jgi:hypothetical protein
MITTITPYRCPPLRKPRIPMIEMMMPTASVSRQNKTTFTRIIKRRANPIIVNNIDVSIPFFSVYLIFDEL